MDKQAASPEKMSWCVQCGELRKEIRRYKLGCADNIGQRYERHSYLEKFEKLDAVGDRDPVQ